MLFYVETGVQFTKDFGDMDESFYSNLTSTYYKALVIMYNNNLLDKFADRTLKVVDDTADMGWGFNDALSDIYTNFYEQ